MMAKSLAATSYLLPFLETFLPGCLIFYHYLLAVNLNEKFGLMQRPRPLRLGIQSLCLVFVLLVGLYMLSLARQAVDEAAIRRVVRTPVEARGALEYYDKCLARNRLLRQILGPESHYYFEEDGELVANFYEFPENVSYRGRRDFVQSLLSDMEKEQQQAAT
jgi:hypothetical protein